MPLNSASSNPPPASDSGCTRNFARARATPWASDTIAPAMDLLFQEKQIRGSWYGSSNVHRDVPKLAKLYTEGAARLNLGKK